MPPPDDLPLDLLAQPLRGQVDWVRRRYGLDPVTACLATLVSVVGACGPSRSILSPVDASFVPPALGVVFHGDAMHLGAAVNLSLDPLRRWLLAQIGRPDKRDLRRSRLHLSDLHRERTHLEHLLQSDGFALPAGPFGVRDEKEAAKLREKTREELEAVLHKLESTTFLLLPHVLADDAPVAQLLTPGRLSLDGAVLAASLDGDAVSAWTATSGPEKAALARLLSASWRGWPQAGDEQTHARPLLSAALVTDSDGARTLWNDKGLAGVNRHLFFMEADDAAFDLDAEPDEDAGDFCNALQPLVTARLEGRAMNHHFNEAATAHFQAFLNRMVAQARELPSHEAHRLERAPLLGLKLALLVHVVSPGQGEEIIDTPTVEFACRLADAMCARDLEFVRQTSPSSRTGRTSEENDGKNMQLSKLVEKLKLRGPLRWRDILRSSRCQKTVPLEELLARGVAAGLILREDDRYRAVESGEAS